jgi:hypothetical protein
MRLAKLALGMLVIGVWVGPNNLYAQRQAIDVNRSSLTIRVFKSGVFSGASLPGFSGQTLTGTQQPAVH